MATVQRCCPKDLECNDLNVSPAVNLPLEESPTTEQLSVESPPLSNFDSLSNLNDSFELLSLSDCDGDDENSNDSYNPACGIKYYLKNFTSKSHETDITYINMVGYDNEIELRYEGDGDDLFATDTYEAEDKAEQEKYARPFDPSQPSCSYAIETCCSYTSTSQQEVEDYCDELQIPDVKMRKTGIPIWDDTFMKEQIRSGYKKLIAKHLNKDLYPTYHTYKRHTKTIIVCDTEESIKCSNAIKIDVENAQGFERFVLQDLPNLSFDEEDYWAENPEELKKYEEWEKKNEKTRDVNEKMNRVEVRRSLQSSQDQRPKAVRGRRKNIPVCQPNMQKLDLTQRGNKISARKSKVVKTDVNPAKKTEKVAVRRKVTPTESEVLIPKRTTNRKKIEEKTGKQQKFKSKITKASSSSLVSKSTVIKQKHSSLTSSIDTEKEIDLESKRSIAQKSMSKNAKVNIEQLAQGKKEKSAIRKKINLAQTVVPVELKSGSRGNRSRCSKVSAVEKSEVIKFIKKCKSVPRKKVSVAKLDITTVEKEDESKQLKKKTPIIKGMSVQLKKNHKLQNHKIKIAEQSSSDSRSESVLDKQKNLCYFSSINTEQESQLKESKLTRTSTTKKLTLKVSKFNEEKVAIYKKDNISIRKNPSRIKSGVSNIKNISKPKNSAERTPAILKYDKFDKKRKALNFEEILDSASTSKPVRQKISSSVDVQYEDISNHHRKEINLPVTTQKPKLKLKKIAMRPSENLKRNAKPAKSGVSTRKQESNEKVVKKKVSAAGSDIYKCNKSFTQTKPATVHRRANYAKSEVSIAKQEPKKNIQKIPAIKNKPQIFKNYGVKLPLKEESIHNVAPKKVSCKCKVSTVKKNYKKKNIKEMAHTITSVSTRGKANESISHLENPETATNNLVTDFHTEKPYIKRAKAKRCRNEI